MKVEKNAWEWDNEWQFVYERMKNGTLPMHGTKVQIKDKSSKNLIENDKTLGDAARENS